MDILEIIGIVAAAFAAWWMYDTRRKNHALDQVENRERERETAMQNVRNDNAQLKQRLATLELQTEAIPRLQEQLKLVQGQLARTEERLTRSEAVAEQRRQESEQLETANGTQRKQITRLERENETLHIQIGAYERAFTLVNTQRETPEAKPDPVHVIGATGTEDKAKAQEG